MLLDDPPHDRQPQTGTVTGSDEGLEDRVELVRVDARPVIADRDAQIWHSFARYSLSGYPNRRLLTRMLPRVAE